MFNWLKRRQPAPEPGKRSAEPQQRKPPARPARRVPDVPPAALPQVVAEGNTEADWSAWEDSKTALDSQLQGLVPSQEIYVRDTRPSQLDEPDPFSSVRGKRDI